GKCHSRKSIWQKVGTLASLHCMAVARSAAAERILVVDDDEPLARVMARVLRSRGFECDVALTASEARRLLAANEYAVALLDVRLPDDSGYGLLEGLRSTRPDTAVVMGKGLAASLMMATARAALRGAAGVEPLEAGVKQAAGVMSAALEVNHAYVTVFHCTFDPDSGDVDYVDAGHGHARLLRGATG